MERTCEFCMDLRPVVYCKADDALFCLPCDAKVHSANALFNRHLRTILCDSCRYRPAYAQCLDHRMLMCRSCDWSLHGVSSEHQKQLVGSYLGCPSAKDFAALWGYGCAELDRILVRNQEFSNSCASTQSGVLNFDTVGESWPQLGSSSNASNVSCSTFASGEESGFALSGQRMEISHKGQQQQNACFIQEQILDLQKFQVTSTIGAQEQTSTFSTSFDTGKRIDYDLDGSQNYQNLVSGVQQSDYPTYELKANSLPVPFSQPEQLPFSSTAADAWLGDTYWQCKSPVHSSQLWSQNMQDLGVCEDTISREDFNIPDVDITFQNFEELFGGDQDPMRALPDDKLLMQCSSTQKDKSHENSCNGSARPIEDSRASQFVPEVLDSPRTIQKSHSTISFTASRQSAESSCGEYLENGLSSYTAKEDAATSHSPDRDFAHPEARENAMMRYKEKKKARMLEKQNRYPAKKPRSDPRRRSNG